MVADAIAYFFCSVVRYRRNHVEASLAHAGIELSPFAVYRSLAHSLVELLRTGLGRPVPTVVFSEAAHAVLKDAQKRPYVIAFGHTGNWEAMAYACSVRMSLVALAKRLSIGVFDRMIASIRRRHGLGVERTASGLLRHLARGVSVAVPIDQVPKASHHGQRESFLGAEASVDRTAALLAAKARCPIVLVTCARDGKVHFVDIAQVHEAPAHPSRGWVRATTSELNQALETFVRAHPSQWLWLHRRWRGPR